ncbi:MAG: phosphatidate cytidylyltransferase [Phycisphaerales bacterium]|nr:MAG: phosphatidate cytidylyltransferase [Phycisphaerales bacterium]
MARRIAYGAMTIAVVLAIVSLDALIATESDGRSGPLGELLCRGSAIPIALVVLFLLGAVELNHLLRLRGTRPHTGFAYLMIVILMLAPWLSAAGWLGQGAAEVEGMYWQVVFLMAATIGTAVLTVIRAATDGAMRDMGVTLLMIVFLGFLGSFGVQLRCGRDIPYEEGAWLVLVVVLVTKVSDIGAFFVGSALGRHKLIPAVSPGKSIEGTIGGVLASAGLAMLIASATSIMATLANNGVCTSLIGTDTATFDLIEQMSRSLSTERSPSALPPLVRGALFGVAMSVSGQFGDLIESCFKRDADIKDSGNVIPQYGGILDLIDSLVLSMPIAWLLLTAVWSVV